MKSHSCLPVCAAIPLAAVLASTALLSEAAPGKKKAASPTVTKAVEIPRSVFVMPTNPQEGRDPFFPRSMRPFTSPIAVVTVRTNPPTPTTLLEDVTCSGISGTIEKPLAIINNRTFEVGEENEIVSGGRTVRIRCLEINRTNGTVLIQAGGERRQLQLLSRN